MSMSIDAQVKLTSPLRGDCFILDVAFDVCDGEILGLLGPSGSGKSMTLKCISGIIRPDRGRIMLNEKILFDSAQKLDVPTRERNVGYLFQSYALFPYMTVSRNIACGIRRREGESGSEWKKRGRALSIRYMELLHIGQYDSRYPHQLSGGQQQRVALARLLASEPSAILLDEPFSALDNELKDAIDSELKSTLLSANCPVLFVSHNAMEIERYCSRTLAIANGSLYGQAG